VQSTLLPLEWAVVTLTLVSQNPCRDVQSKLLPHFTDERLRHTVSLPRDRKGAMDGL
jgi:hypothetical protein